MSFMLVKVPNAAISSTKKSVGACGEGVFVGNIVGRVQGDCEAVGDLGHTHFAAEQDYSRTTKVYQLAPQEVDVVRSREKACS